MVQQKEKIRVALAQINVTVGALAQNANKIILGAMRAKEHGADLVAFPELAITGYPPEDLLFKSQFVSDNLKELKRVVSSIGDIVAVVGFCDKAGKDLYNAAAIIHQGKMRGTYHKAFLPNYGVFDEKRYFAAGKKFPLFGVGATTFGVNICEDIWHLDGPAGIQAYLGARLLININASPYHMGKGLLRQQILKKQARRNKIFIVYTNLVGGQDELVFDGSSLVVDDKGRLIAQAKAFQEQLLFVDIEIKQAQRKPKFFLKKISQGKPAIEKPAVSSLKDETEEVYAALVLGLKDYMAKNHFKKAVVGLSGGIDSSLVAALAVDSVGCKNVVGISMPSAYTSLASKDDAALLAKNLGLELEVIPIQEVFEKYLATLKEAFGPKGPDATEENLQARIRGSILMALSNKFGYLALNTGNKSEVSCGYCTLYGDMAGGFGVIKDVPKTFVYKLAEYKNKKEGREIIPSRIFEKAPTAELRPNQKDSDTLPEYNILDVILKHYVEEDKSVTEMVNGGFNKEVVARVMHMVDFNEYKRRQAAPGIKITPKAFGKDRRMPITNGYR